MRRIKRRELSLVEAEAFGRSASLVTPNLFVIGSAKCGTTSLHHVLGQHPDIFMLPEKEPQFLVSQGQIEKGPVEYLASFQAGRDQSFRGESSHAYATSHESAPLIATLFPDAVFVMIVRDPAERAHSHFVHMQRHGFERLSTFEAALAAEEERHSSSRFQAHAKDYLWNYFYKRTGLYGEQVERFMSRFPRSRFHFLHLDELKTDMLQTANEIFRFLNLTEVTSVDEARLNVGATTARFPGLTSVGRALSRDNKALLRVGYKASQMVNRTPAPTLAPETREGLSKYFAQDKEQFAELTGLRLP